MASEPDDYQSISDNCPGYMVLISEGIICTRCAGEKRHKSNECPKPTSAADLATETVPEDSPPGTDNADSELESLSDTDSESSGGTASSEGSETQVTKAHRSDQGGSHPQYTHLPRRDPKRPDGDRTNTKPVRISPSQPDYRPAREVPLSNPRRSHEIPTKTTGQASKKTYGTAKSTEPPSTNDCSSIERQDHKTQRGSNSRHRSAHRAATYGASRGRLPSKSLADTTGKFDYSNTTCPSSFGFGQLPSEAMG